MEIVDLFHRDAPKFADEYLNLAQSSSPYESKVGRKMLELLKRLSTIAGPRLFASRFSDELCLNYTDGTAHSTMIRVAVDHPDYALLEDGLPPLHYRLRYDLPPPHSPYNPETVDERTPNVHTACEIIRKAIRICEGVM
jgi:hypothetical protein